MATREELVVRRDALQIELERAVQRIAAGDRSQQFDLSVKQAAFDRLNDKIGQCDALGRAPMTRQIRVSSSRGY